MLSYFHPNQPHHTPINTNIPQNTLTYPNRTKCTPTYPNILPIYANIRQQDNFILWTPTKTETLGLYRSHPTCSDLRLSRMGAQNDTNNSEPTLYPKQKSSHCHLCLLSRHSNTGIGGHSGLETPGPGHRRHSTGHQSKD